MNGVRLIVGLANPGAEYAGTRHNVGAWLLHELAQKHELRFSQSSKCHGLLASYASSDHSCYLLEPTTFMNDSGRAVCSAMQFYKLLPEQVLVIHDELDFEPGVVRLKYGGGHGGHNGLRDIIAQLNTPNFYRLRMGIGHPGHRDQVTPYVLGAPNKVDRDEIMSSIHQALPVMNDLIQGNVEKAMRILHGVIDGI